MTRISVRKDGPSGLWVIYEGDRAANFAMDWTFAMQVADFLAQARADELAERIAAIPAMPLMTGIPQATAMRQAMWRRNLDLADAIIRMGLI